MFEFAFVKAIEVVGYRISTLIEIIGKVVSAIKAMIREAIDGINSLISLINKIPGVNIPGISFGGGESSNAGGGERAGGFIPTISSGGGAGFLGGGGGAGGGGAGGGGVDLAKLSGGLVTSPADLVAKLTATSQKLSDIDFALRTGQINKVQGSKLLSQTEKEFNVLQRVAEAFANIQPITNRASAATTGPALGRFRLGLSCRTRYSSNFFTLLPKANDLLLAALASLHNVRLLWMGGRGARRVALHPRLFDRLNH